MYYVYNANLIDLYADNTVDFVANQCNCFGHMGKGIALEIKQRIPEAYGADVNFPIEKGEARLGKFSWYDDGLHGGVVNLYGQLHWNKKGQNTDSWALDNAMTEFFDMLRHNHPFFTKQTSRGKYNVGFPRLIGCGLGGGEWSVVHKMLEAKGFEYQDIANIWIVSLDKSPYEQIESMTPPVERKKAWELN